MTPTERIAVSLLGWTPDNAACQEADVDVRAVFAKQGAQAVYFWTDDVEPLHSDGAHNDDWPDLTTLDGCAAFERALIHKCDMSRYVSRLHDIVSAGYQGPRWRSVLFATQSDRVSACLGMLDEIEGKR